MDVGFEWNDLDDAEKTLFILENPDESEKVVSTNASVDTMYSVNNAIMKESQIGTEGDMFSKIGIVILLEKCLKSHLASLSNTSTSIFTPDEIANENYNTIPFRCM